MSNDIDINQIAANVISTQVDNLIEAMRETTSRVTERFSISLRGKWDKFVKESLKRHSFSRSFFHRSEPVYIYSFYVPIGVRSNTISIPAASAEPLFAVSPRLIIQGSGGCGKSVLTRHLLLGILRANTKIPLLIELRELNKRDVPLITLIQEALKQGGLELSDGTILHLLSKGLLALLFDGFDELYGKLRDNASSSIKDLAAECPKAWMLVTSRPDSEFQGWTDFMTFDAAPLTLAQAVELVDKTPVESELKSRFIDDLQKSLFEKHKSFLSNPLLLSIMLLTYHDSAEIPTKLSVFYSQAYEALFHRHDAWKGGFQRERRSGLDIHDFARGFSAFSLLTYDRGLFSFSRGIAVQVAKQASEFVHVNFDANDFLQDAIQATCLLIEDGFQLAYSHRSFQEYFAARFIAEATPDVKGPLLERFGSKVRTDTVVALLHEIQPEFVETVYLLPRIDSFLKELRIMRLPITRAAHVRFLRKYFSHFNFKPNGTYSCYTATKTDAMFEVMRFAIHQCGYLTDLGDFLEVKYDLRGPLGKHHSPDQIVTVAANSLTVRHPVARELYVHGMFFSNRLLELLFEIRAAILRKRTSTERSLEELLTGA